MHFKHCNAFSLETNRAANEESEEKKRRMSEQWGSRIFFYAANEFYLFKFNNFASLFLLI